MKKNYQSGFTLIEVMITVAILGILAAVAFPSYQSYVMRTHRVTAGACLSEMAQQMERRYTSNLAYTGAAVPVLPCATEVAGRYGFAFATGEPTATTYTINAAPTGAQSGDTQCGTLSITEAGVKGISGTGTAASCWR